MPLPPRAVYEALPQRENGVGSIRGFLEELQVATRQLPGRLAEPRRLWRRYFTYTSLFVWHSVRDALRGGPPVGSGK
jgi:NifB/MoaA-like Fe-S oxidoreductase